MTRKECPRCHQVRLLGPWRSDATWTELCGGCKIDLDAIALAADLIGRHLAPTSDVARGAVARLEAMLASKPARPTPDEGRRLLDEYDRATRHSYVTGGPERLRAARAALLRALGVEA